MYKRCTFFQTTSPWIKEFRYKTKYRKEKLKEGLPTYIVNRKMKDKKYPLYESCIKIKSFSYKIKNKNEHNFLLPLSIRKYNSNFKYYLIGVKIRWKSLILDKLTNLIPSKVHQCNAHRCVLIRSHLIIWHFLPFTNLKLNNI